MIKNILLVGLIGCLLSGCMVMTVGKVVGAGFVAAVPQQSSAPVYTDEDDED